MEENSFRITTDKTLMELSPHGSIKYPLYYCDGELRYLIHHCIEWHWHTDLEFLYVQNGPIHFEIGQNHFTLTAGQGIFINSKVLHKYYCEESLPGVIPGFVFAPSFIVPEGNLMYEKYVLPIISSSLEYCILDPESPWQKDVLDLLKKMISIQTNFSESELYLSAKLQSLWSKFYLNIQADLQPKDPTASTAAQARLQLLMQYIHMHYTEPITLDDLSEHAKISKTTILQLFQSYLQDTPIQYLIKYRLQQGAVLLSTTKLKVRDIASQVGFESNEYFCRTFKKQYNMTPLNYRKRNSI